MKLTLRNRNEGFTLIEILMVLLLIGILATIGITQFTDFSGEARDNTARANVKILRNAISTQSAQMRLRCGVTGSTYPALDTLEANNITGGAAPECTAGEVPNEADRVFVQGGIPPNPWGANQSNDVVQCTLGGCTTRTTACVGGGARAAADDGWCYNTATGEIWANSSNSTTGESEDTF